MDEAKHRTWAAEETDLDHHHHHHNHIVGFRYFVSIVDILHLSTKCRIESICSTTIDIRFRF